MPFKLTIEEVEDDEVGEGVMLEGNSEPSEYRCKDKKKKHRRGMTLGDALAKIED